MTHNNTDQIMHEESERVSKDLRKRALEEIQKSLQAYFNTLREVCGRDVDYLDELQIDLPDHNTIAFVSFENLEQWYAEEEKESIIEPGTWQGNKRHGDNF